MQSSKQIAIPVVVYSLFDKLLLPAEAESDRWPLDDTVV